MKKRKSAYKNKSSFGFLAILIILAFTAGITFLILSLLVPAKKNEEPETYNTVVNETEQKKKENQTSTNEDDPEEPHSPKQYEDDENPDPKTINASITKNDVADGKYTLRVTIYELLSSGTCRLIMTSGKNQLKQEVAIINTGAESSSCEGFDIQADGIASGTYNFTVSLKSGNKTGEVKGTIKI